MPTVGQIQLDNFYRSVQFQNPALADDIRDDVICVSMYGLAADKGPAKDAVDRLRTKAFDMPVVFARVLDSALADLGF
jgi:hypothetical protein